MPHPTQYRSFGEEKEDIYLAQTMTTIAHNRTIILISLLSQVARKPEGQQTGHPNGPTKHIQFLNYKKN